MGIGRGALTKLARVLHTWSDAPNVGRITMHCFMDGEAQQVGGNRVLSNGQPLMRGLL